MKSGDDVRQELLAMQLLKRFAAIFRDNRLNLWVRPYEVLVTGCSTGFIEVVPDALSIHQVKTRYKRDVICKSCRGLGGFNPKTSALTALL